MQETDVLREWQQGGEQPTKSTEVGSSIQGMAGRRACKSTELGGGLQQLIWTLSFDEIG